MNANIKTERVTVNQETIKKSIRVGTSRCFLNTIMLVLWWVVYYKHTLPSKNQNKNIDEKIFYQLGDHPWKWNSGLSQTDDSLICNRDCWWFDCTKAVDPSAAPTYPKGRPAKSSHPVRYSDRSSQASDTAGHAIAVTRARDYLVSDPVRSSRVVWGRICESTRSCSCDRVSISSSAVVLWNSVSWIHLRTRNQHFNDFHEFC